MKKLILIILAVLMLSGCAKFGTGEQIGYIVAVDDGMVWDRVWIKTDQMTSDPDCYVLEEDHELKEEFKLLLEGQRKVKIKYNKHFATVGCSPDEITKYEILTPPTNE